VPLSRRRIGPNLRRRGRGLHRIEQFGAGDEHDARARKSEQPTAKSRILCEVMLAAFDRADGDRIGHQPRFRAGLDDEKATEFLQHVHSLTRERLNRSFEPFSR